MLRRRTPLFALLLIAFALAVALGVSPAVNVVAHGIGAIAAEDERHSALALGETAEDHGHPHDREEPAELSIPGSLPSSDHGHVHGHDANDHTHDTGSPAKFRTTGTHPLMRTFGPFAEAPAPTTPIFRLDRPPRFAA